MHITHTSHRIMHTHTRTHSRTHARTRKHTHAQTHTHTHTHTGQLRWQGHLDLLPLHILLPDHQHQHPQGRTWHPLLPHVEQLLVYLTRLLVLPLPRPGLQPGLVAVVGSSDHGCHGEPNPNRNPTLPPVTNPAPNPNPVTAPVPNPAPNP